MTVWRWCRRERGLLPSLAEICTKIPRNRNLLLVIKLYRYLVDDSAFAEKLEIMEKPYFRIGGYTLLATEAGLPKDMYRAVHARKNSSNIELVVTTHRNAANHKDQPPGKQRKGAVYDGDGWIGTIYTIRPIPDYLHNSPHTITMDMRRPSSVLGSTR